MAPSKIGIKAQALEGISIRDISHMNDPHELTDGGMESVDWHSFFNFEYDPSTTVGAAPSHEVITGETGSGMLP